MAAFKLPEELMLCILTRLPVKSLCRFKCVCKSWLSLFSTSDFVAQHLHLTASNPENNSLAILHPSNSKIEFFFNDNSYIIKAVQSNTLLELVGCYNGLVALVCPYFSRIILWNPATRQWKFFRHPVDLETIFLGICSVGMGFDSATNDFKVLSIVGASCFLSGFPDGDDLQVVNKVNVYSANRDCWETVETGFIFCVNNRENDAILSGVPYWSGYVSDLGDEGGSGAVYLRYDVRNGVFEHIPAPKLELRYDLNNNFKPTTHLVEWKDSLAILVHSRVEAVGVVIFDECEGEWTTKFSIGIPICITTLYCKGTEILLGTIMGEIEKLVLFDSETMEIRHETAYCDVFGPFSDIIAPFNYIESLVHLKDMKMVKEVEGRFEFDIALRSFDEELERVLGSQ